MLFQWPDYERLDCDWGLDCDGLNDVKCCIDSNYWGMFVMTCLLHSSSLKRNIVEAKTAASYAKN